MNVNQYIAVGHVTKDPEMKKLDGGASKVATFRLAINRSFKKGNDWVEKPTFIDCEAWNQKADYVVDKVQKGTEVYIRGRLETDEWESKEGERRSKNKIYVLEVQAGKNRKGGAEAKGAEGSDGYDGAELPF